MLTVEFSPFPILATDRLLLRVISHEDAEALYALRADEQVMQFLDRPLAKTIEEAHELIGKIELAVKENDGITWGITIRENPATLVGTIGYWNMMKEHYRAEIGYMLHPDLQGKGLMQEAMEKVLDFGFNTMGLHSVEANVNPGNEPSIRLLERNKFVREAYYKENYYYNGKFLDTMIYSKLASSP